MSQEHYNLVSFWTQVSFSRVVRLGKALKGVQKCQKWGFILSLDPASPPTTVKRI